MRKNFQLSNNRLYSVKHLQGNKIVQSLNVLKVCVTFTGKASFKTVPILQ